MPDTIPRMTERHIEALKALTDGWPFRDEVQIAAYEILSFIQSAGVSRKSDTTLDLEAIKARCEAATAGPWQAYFTTHGDPYVAEEGRPKFGMVVSTSPDDYGRANCQFIAHARTDIPALIAEIERLLSGDASGSGERT